MAKKSEKPYKPRKRIQHFCFCLGLRSGSILSTLWWIISGFVLAIYLAYAAVSGSHSAFMKYKPLTIMVALESLMIFFVALFGLHALVTRNTVPAIRIYVRLAWLFMVLLWSLASVSGFAVFVASKENDCSSPNTVCDDYWKHKAMKLFVAITFPVLLNLYATIILHVYLMRREFKYNKHGEIYNPRNSIISDMTSINFTQSRPASSIMTGIDNSRSRPASSIITAIDNSRSQPISVANVIPGINTSRSRPTTLLTPPAYSLPHRLNNLVINEESKRNAMYFDDSKIDMEDSGSGNNYNNNSDATTRVPRSYNPLRRQNTWERARFEQDMESPFGSMDITEYNN